MDYVSNFIAAMHDAGLAPARSQDIFPTRKWTDYQLAADPKGKKKGYYILEVDGDSAIGRFGDRRMCGETIGWFSKSSRKFTAQEKADYKRRQQEAQKRRDDEEQRDREETARLSKQIWQNTKAVERHDYLEKKQAHAHGLRVDDEGRLVIPMYADGQLWNVQTISPDGEKLFQARGRKKGCYYPIASMTEDLSIICIVEGFATGDAVRRATGLPVAVAFDAGNILPVAKQFREKHADAKIIICGDNDQWTKNPKGQPWNPGVEKGNEAATAVNGIALYPDVAADDPKRRTDWNDMLVTEGIDYVKNKIMSVALSVADVMGAIPAAGYSVEEYVQQHGDVPTHDKYDEGWKEELIATDKGLKPGSIKNMYLYLRHSSEFAGIFAYNEFHHAVMAVRCPNWEDPERFQPRRIDDIMVTMTTTALEKYGMAADTNKAYKAIQAAAYDNRFHPAREYFETLKWDKVARLDRWLTYYMGCESEAPEYLAFVGRKWLTAGVARIYEPGCKFDHVLVLEGAQGSYKSTSLKRLSTFGCDKPVEYFTDSVTIADIQNKDTIMKIQGSVIVELSELSGFSKKDDEEIKRWITLQHDEIRLPYGRETSRFNRQFILAATTNKYDYLKDPTGNRRYWPVLAGRSIDVDGIARDREQLWAEAVATYKNGIYLGPEPHEEELANIERRKRLSQDPWTDAVLDAIPGVRFRVSDIMGYMGMVLREKDERAARRISNILQIHGYENRPVWHNGKTERFWMKKEDEVLL